MLGPQAASVPEPFANTEKLRTCEIPVLIIHADQDHIVPYAHAQKNLEACGSSKKLLVTISGANHNNVFSTDPDRYMSSIRSFVVTRGDTDVVYKELPQNKCCLLM